MKKARARVAELVDALDLESSASGVGVRFPPLAPLIAIIKRSHKWNIKLKIFLRLRKRLRLM